MRLSKIRILAMIAAMAALPPLAATSCAEPNTSTSTGGGGGAGGAGGAGAGGSPDGGTLDAQDEDPVIVEPDSGMSDGPIGDGCVSATVEGEKVPLDMLVLLDRSGSMTTDDRWGAAVKAIKGFADSAGVAGLGLGLQYFPPLSGNECTPATYALPPVPIALLPGNAVAMKQSLESSKPSGGTPMRPALEGAVTAMKTYLQQNATHEGVVILVTDGTPGGCSNNTAAAVTQTAANALAGTPAIRTFAVGMEGADFGNLDQIAAAGGTTKSFDVGSGPAATQALLAALQKIRQSALSCEYILPLPDPKQGTLDIESVEVNFTPGINEPTVGIQKVPNLGACGQISGGFYYDDPSSPTRIILCPASCETVQSGTENAKVSVVLGCIAPPPR